MAEAYHRKLQVYDPILAARKVRKLLSDRRCANHLTHTLRNLVVAYHRKLQVYDPVLVALKNYIASGWSI